MTVSSVPALGRRAVVGGAFAGLVATSLTAAPTASAPGAMMPTSVSADRQGHRVGPRLRDPFTLGVASGDPEPHGVVLWTRLAPEPLAADGKGGMPDREVAVDWALAEDARFTRAVRSGTVRVLPSTAHSLHVEVDGLEPGREYHYRFRAEGHLSPIGRTRTAPSYGSSPSSLKLAVASCADFEHGFFTAYRRIAEEEPDLVLHLGDYMYEVGKGTFVALPHNVRSHRGPETVTLADYRQRHAQYKNDADLQAAHAAAPWSVVFDDHEVDANWAGMTPESRQPHFARRRAAAFQAYYENMPLRRKSLPSGPYMRIHRRVKWGDLATLHLLDTRQYRSDQACGDGRHSGCSARFRPDRTILGDRQERWLLDGLASSGSRWDVLGQQVFFAQKDLAPGPAEKFGMDAWDGYAAARQRLLDGMVERRVRNPVVLTGDVHMHCANDLHRNPGNPRSRPVGVELVTTSVTSGGDGWDRTPRTDTLLEENPHIRFVNSRRGYLLARFGRDHLQADFKVLPYVQKPGARVSTRASFVVEDGNPGLVRA